MSEETATRGLEGVVAARTRMSHVDGQGGVLIIGGYELSELAGRVSFEAAAHLLWKGALPDRAELATLRAEMAALRKLPESTMQVLRSAPGGGEGARYLLGHGDRSRHERIDVHGARDRQHALGHGERGHRRDRGVEGAAPRRSTRPCARHAAGDRERGECRSMAEKRARGR